MTTTTDDEIERAGMTVLDSDTDSRLFSSEGEPRERTKTYEKPDLTTEEKEQWKLITNPRQEKRRKRRSEKRKEDNATKTVTKTTKANDGKTTTTKNTQQQKAHTRDKHITQTNNKMDHSTTDKIQQTNNDQDKRKENTKDNINNKEKKESTTVINDTEEPNSAYSENYRPIREDLTMDKTVAEAAVKEAKFFLRIYPRNRSQFNPNIAFAEFFRVIHEIDGDALICPFDKNSPRPILFHTDDLPQNKERLHYLYSMKERNGAWSCVVRILTEADDWKLLAASQMRIFLNHTGMQATKQELDSPNLANAGWFMGLHPKLTNRKSMKQRIEQLMPEQNKIPFEIRGGDVYLPKGVGHPRDPNRRQKVEALQVFCDSSDVATLQQAIVGMVRPGNSLGERFIRFAGWIDTYPNDEMQSWIDNQRELVQYAARQPLRFLPLQGNMDVPITMYDGEITTAKKWFEEQQEFRTEAGLLQVETGRYQDEEATVVYLKHAREVAKVNMEMLINRLQKQISDESRQAVFSPIYTHAMTHKPQEITTMVREARQYYEAKKARKERAERYKKKKALSQQSLKKVLFSKGPTSPPPANGAPSYASILRKRQASPSLPQTQPEPPAQIEIDDIEEFSDTPVPESEERSPPMKRSKTEDMLQALEERMAAIGSNTEKANKKVEELENLVQRTVGKTLEMATEVEKLSNTVAQLPEKITDPLTKRIDDLERQHKETFAMVTKRHEELKEGININDIEMLNLSKITSRTEKQQYQANILIEDIRKRIQRQEHKVPPQRFEKHHQNIQNMLHEIRLIQEHLPDPDNPSVTRLEMYDVFRSFSAIAMNMVKRGINKFISTVESQDTYLEEETCCEDMEEEIVTDEDEDDDEQSLDWSAKIRKECCTTLIEEMESMMHRRAMIALLRRRKSGLKAEQAQEESSESETETASNTSTEPKCTATTAESDEEEDDATSEKNGEENQNAEEEEHKLAEVADILTGIQEETEEDWKLDNLIGTTATSESAGTEQPENSEEANDAENTQNRREDNAVERNDTAASTKPIQPAKARRSVRLATLAATTANAMDNVNTRPPLQDITQVEKPSEEGGKAQS